MQPKRKGTWLQVRDMVLSAWRHAAMLVHWAVLTTLFKTMSNDIFLGCPFNLASYALLTHMLAQVCGLEVGELVWSGADVHIYKNHVEQVKTQIERYDNGEVFDAPTLVLNKDITDIDDFTFDDIQLINYKNAGKLTGEVAV